MLIALASLAAFAAAFALDFATARYTRAVQHDEMHAAGLWSVAMALLSSVGVLALIEVSPWILVPECLGLYLGTLAAARRRRPARVEPDGLPR